MTTPNTSHATARPIINPPAANTLPLSYAQGAVGVHDQRGTAQKMYHHAPENSSAVG
jgi:hypothetical protein